MTTALTPTAGNTAPIVVPEGHILQRAIYWANLPDEERLMAYLGNGMVERVAYAELAAFDVRLSALLERLLKDSYPTNVYRGTIFDVLSYWSSPTYRFMESNGEEAVTTLVQTLEKSPNGTCVSMLVRLHVTGDLLLPNGDSVAFPKSSCSGLIHVDSAWLDAHHQGWAERALVAQSMECDDLTLTETVFGESYPPCVQREGSGSLDALELS